MKTALILLIFSAVFLVACSEGVVKSYKLALQWPNAYCYTKEAVESSSCKHEVPQDFKIHGLWPEIKKRKSVTPSPEKFDVNELKKEEELYSSLIEEWPNLHGKDYRKHERFWKHEWKEHGRYSGRTLVNYFQTTVNLKKEVNNHGLIDHLKAHNIIPSNEISYPARKFLASIFAKTQLHTELKCNAGHDGKKQFYEIYFCVTTDVQFINCSLPYKVTNCDKDGNQESGRFAPPKHPPNIHDEL